MSTIRRGALATGGRSLAIGLLGLAAVGAARAQGDEPAPAEQSELDLFKLSDDLNQETAIASGRLETVAETPGVVTLITREEIINSGARDLIDVLQLVPGFSAVGVDVEGIADFGFRGIWAHEGKILFMIDGEPMNEILFDDNALGHHYPVEQIDRIEIIRGPGSVLYGGWAELAVINVITRSAKQLHGAAASLYYGQLQGAFGQADLNLALGQENLGGVKDLDVTAWLYWGRGNRSDQSYTDFYGDSYSLAGNSALDPFMINAAVSWRDLHLRLIYDHYHVTEADSYNQIDGYGLPALGTLYPVDEWFITTIIDGYYDLKLGKVTLTPRFTYKRQEPWLVPDQSAANDYFNVTGERYTGRLTLTWEILQSLSVLVGTEDYFEQAWLNQTPAAGSTGVSWFGAQLSPPQQLTSFSDYNLAAFAEAQDRSIIGNLTLGARFEHNSVTGNSFVPRGALTKVIGRFHFKLLYSFAFRAPGIEDINYSPPGQPIQPETTRDGEIEVGYQLTDHLYLGVNGFDIEIYNPIVYTFSNSGATQNYVNFPKTGTQGLEAEFRLKYRWGYLNLNYSYYSAWSIFADAAKNQVPVYAVPNDPGLLAAFPAHKVSLNGHFVVWKGLSLNPSGNFLSARYGGLTGDGNGNGVAGFTPPLFLLNLYVMYSDLATKGLDLGVGLFDALNQQYAYIQPYQSGHAPLPGPDREIVARLAYALPF